MWANIVLAETSTSLIQYYRKYFRHMLFLPSFGERKKNIAPRLHGRFKLRQIYHGLLPWLSVVLLILLILAPIFLFGWFLFYTDVFAIKAVTIVDARPHTEEATRNIVKKALEGLPPYGSIFFINTDDLKMNIESALAQVRTLQVTRSLPSTIKIIVQEKQPSLLLVSNGSYYFVDDQGIPYEEAHLDTLPGIVLPTVHNADDKAKVTIGVAVVAPEFVDFVEYVQQHLPEYINAQVARIQIPSLAAREVHFVMDTNWELKLDVTRDKEQQLNILKRLVTEMISEDELETLDYIDLRIPNRVYYKTRDALPQTDTFKNSSADTQ